MSLSGDTCMNCGNINTSTFSRRCRACNVQIEQLELLKNQNRQNYSTDASSSGEPTNVVAGLAMIVAWAIIWGMSSNYNYGWYGLLLGWLPAALIGALVQRFIAEIIGLIVLVAGLVWFFN